jgi:phage recombination protein Bet
MSNVAVIEHRPMKSITLTMADKFGMEPNAFEATVRATCMRPDKNGRVPSREEFAAFLLVAKEYDLNPLTKEIYAFPQKGGGIVPIVSVDGWLKLINSHPQFDGMELTDGLDAKGELASVTCSLWRKDRSRPVTMTEYLKECIRDTEPWKMKHRMLRHKALIQAARYAFGFAGIYDPDEGERIVENVDAAPAIPIPPTPPSLGVAQSAERLAVNEDVAGSSPASQANPKIEEIQRQDEEGIGKIAKGPNRAERGDVFDKHRVLIPLGALTDWERFHKALDSAPTPDAANAMFDALTKNMHRPEDLEEAQDRLREVMSKFPVEEE